MNSLFQNAVEAIQLGVEDYQANDPRRAGSATRNFFAGLLLLAKDALVRAAPNANPKIVVAAKLKPIPDGAGGVVIEPDGSKTIELQEIGKRLADFGIAIDDAALRSLSKIRNEIEHYY